MVSLGPEGVNPVYAEYPIQPIPLGVDDPLVTHLPVLFVVLLCTRYHDLLDLIQALYLHIHDLLLHLLHLEQDVLRMDAFATLNAMCYTEFDLQHTRVDVQVDLLGPNAKLLLCHYGVLDIISPNVQLQVMYGCLIQLQAEVATPNRVDLINGLEDLPDLGLLNLDEHLTCHDVIEHILRQQPNPYDGRFNELRRIDDLLDAGDTECDVHAGHTGEVERLQGHLCGGLSDGL